MEKATLAAGKTLLISGPASLVLIDGEAEVLGAPIEKEERLLVREARQIPVEAMTDSVLRISLGEVASRSELKGTTIPNSWVTLADAALELSNPKIVTIGTTDSGKSTLCTYITNMLLEQYQRVSVIDADVGQSDIGPPGTIGLGATDEYLLSLADLNPISMFFIGHTSPTPARDKVISGIRKLMTSPSIGQDPLIINTDGWIAGDEAYDFKARMINEISPDLVAAIQTNDQLSPITEKTRATTIVVQPPTVAKRREREDRRRLRELSYRKHLTGSICRNIEFDKVRLIGAELRNGRLRSAPKKIHSMVGFLNNDELLIRIGILKEVEQKEGIMKVYTPFRGLPGTIEFGSIRLDDSGKELAP